MGPGIRGRLGEVRGDDTQRAATFQATTFHDATKYYSLSDTEPGDERIGIGDPATRTEAIWQKDWDIKPFLYKVYETLPPIELTRDLPDTGRPALEAIAATGAEAPAPYVVPDRALLGRLGLLTNGSLDRTWTTRDGRVHHYRTAGGTGAQYHLELYFVCTDLADLDAGVYHYSAIDHSLRLLRAGDFRSALVEATGNEPSIAAAPVVLAMTSTFWRNAWRYRERAYRHTYWDAGTSLSHILAVAASTQVATKLVFGYADPLVNALLGIDGMRESTVALVALGNAETGPPSAPPFGRLDLPTTRLSSAEVTFHAITDMHLASSLSTGAEAAQWRSREWRRPSQPTGELTELRPLPTDRLDPRPAEQIIFRRRSTRNYDTDVAIPFDQFSTLLERSTRGVASDVLVPGAPLTELYLIVNAVEGLTPGVYLHHPELHAVELVRAGTFRKEAARIAAGQQYAGDAHVNLYYLAHLPSVLERYGNRGYRLAQLEGALHAGKLHLGTHALGLGAVGSTSFDDEVVDFFSPHAAGKDYMFVTVFGKRRRVRQS
jgi:SagB-type dehydrogenase family enzyme